MCAKIIHRNPEKYEYAYLLYMGRHSGKLICEKVGITPATLQKWKEDGMWESKRAAKTISVDELISKTLSKISSMLDDENFNADNFSKAVAQLKNLKSGATIDDRITTLTEFGDYMIQKMAIDKKVDSEFIKKLTEYQDRYILENIRNGTQGK